MNAFDGNGAIEVARGERAIIAVPELRREASRRSGEARIEEAEGLAEAIGIDVDCRKSLPGARTPASDTARQGPGRGDRGTGERAGRGPSDRRCPAYAGPAEKSRGRGRNQGHRPDRIDPGDFRRARGNGGRAAPGRARAPRLPGGPTGSELDPPRAPARRLRLPRRPWRDPDRGRPPPDPRSDGEDSPRAGPGEANARAAPRPAPARALAGGRARGLYQRRKIDPFQSADGRSCVRREPAFRDSGPDDAGHQAARVRQGDPVGHGRIRLRPADRVDRRLPRDAGRGRAADLLVHVRNMAHPDNEAQGEDVEDVLSSLGLAEEGAPPRIEAWNKIDLLSARGARTAGRGSEAPRGRRADFRRYRRRVCRAARADGAVAAQRRAGARDTPAGERGRQDRLASRARRGADQAIDHDQVQLSVRLSPDNWARFQAMEAA